MDRFSRLILAFSCAAILLLQASGLHLHASLEPENGGLHAEHFHVADPDGHDHVADVDVSLVELSIWAKLYPLLLILLPLCLAASVIAWRSRFSIPADPLSSSHVRWRPPLRAPPSQY
jgi:hypothetical protein